MSNTVPSQTYELLKSVVGDIENYSVVLRGRNKEGEGYFGEISYISLKEKNGEKTIDLVIKEALLGRNVHPVRGYYLNEIYFYTKVWPFFQRFQKTLSPSKNSFDKIPRCFATISEDKDEKLVLENLRYQNFETFNRRKPFDKAHAEYIFIQYAKFHAISFACKQLNPQEYFEVSEGLTNLWCKLCEVKGFNTYVKLLHERCLKNLHPEEDAAAIEKYKRYVDDGLKIFYDSNIYKGNYSAVLHGDSWSNNMMFKYEDSRKPIDIRFFDFQLSKVGTPVHDLSYCIYSGGSKEMFNDLDYYLKVYHVNLLETVKGFGCNTENVYPFEELKNDWKEYCKIGFAMGLMQWKAKLNHRYEDEPEDIKYDEDTFKERARDLILHMCENDFL